MLFLRSRDDMTAGERTRIWVLFRLNSMLPSPDGEARPVIIERCYWPLLRAAESCGFPVGITIAGDTLAAIDRLDPAWTEKLRELAAQGLVEPIACGAAHLIGPLVPDMVNAANLRLGNASYERFLGHRPALLFVNEHCFSRSMVDHYIDAGYSGFIMDWDSAQLAQPASDATWRYAPRLALSAKGRSLPVLWGMAVARQKFRRLADGTDDRAAYWQWLDRQLARRVPALNLYCDDAEILDFRPSRSAAEPETQGASWNVIENLFLDLCQDRRIACGRPSDILSGLPPTGTAPLALTTAAMPLPTAQHERYNVLRWAVTGRDSIGINSRCLALAHRLRDSLSATDEDWRELCFLYGSDFRTQVTDQRWAAYRERLGMFERRWNHGEVSPLGVLRRPETGSLRLEPRLDGILCLEAKTLAVELNAKRGLAIHRMWHHEDRQRWLLGTIPIGTYDDIRLGADFYSTHLVFRQPGKAAEVTDLSPAEVWLREESEWLSIYAEVNTTLGPVEKEIRLHRNAPRLDVLYQLNWPALPLGVLRLGHLTINPEAFNPDALWYATHNGGDQPERFHLNGGEFDHGRPVSTLVTATTALGMTEDTLAFGDDRRSITVTALREQTAVVPILVWRRLREGFFFRIAFSAGEMDDTVTHNEPSRAEHWPMKFAFSLTLDAAN